MKKNINIAFKLFSIFALSLITILSADAVIHNTCNSVYNLGASDCQSGGLDLYRYGGVCSTTGTIDAAQVSCDAQVKSYTPTSYALGGGTYQVATYAWSSCSCNITCDMTNAVEVEDSVAGTCAGSEITVFNAGTCEYSCQVTTPTYLTKYVGGTGSAIEASVVYQNTSGNVGIDQIDPTEKLEVNGNVLADEYHYTSDARLKTNVSRIQNALQKVLALTGVVFDWKKSGRTNIGFIAQEVEHIVPEIVFGEGKQMKSVSYGNITALLVEAIREQQKQIDKLKALVKKLTE